MDTDHPSATDDRLAAVLAKLEERYRSEALAGVPVNATPATLVKAELASSPGGRLVGFHAYNSNASTQYVMLFDTTTQPANATVTSLVWPIAGGASLDIEFYKPRVFNSGIFICNSTTDTSLTLGAADCFFDVNYF